ncbi:hypothetical protein NQ314_015949 [Rhamnusium bicolor]|uniref:Shugoshin C-terminal domain-containing protein n=1 Tax=Rhamnusium bicolor TaxID=1586634 RepID=A0AAV8WXH2_9CUCU|nr:hypothetical protein NQ314_015949 [Rhamnusium bicolor]
MYTKVQDQMDLKNGIVDDRMHTSCTLKGKHRCEDFEDHDVKIENKLANIKRLCHNNKKGTNYSCEASTSNNISKPKLRVNIEKCNLYSINYSNIHRCDLKNEKRNVSPNLEQKMKSAKLDTWQETLENCHNINDLNKIKDKGQLLLDAIERSGQKSTNEIRKEGSDKSMGKCVQKHKKCAKTSESDNVNCDMSESDIFSIKEKNNFNIYVDNHCDSPIPIFGQKKIKDISNVDISKLKPTRRISARQKIDFDDMEHSLSSQKSNVKCDKNLNSREKKSKESNVIVDVPSPSEQAKFRKNLDNAASMVFHSRTGLPLTSSPAPARRGRSCFDFDSTLNSVSAIKR